MARLADKAIPDSAAMAAALEIHDCSLSSPARIVGLDPQECNPCPASARLRVRFDAPLRRLPARPGGLLSIQPPFSRCGHCRYGCATKACPCDFSLSRCAFSLPPPPPRSARRVQESAARSPRSTRIASTCGWDARCRCPHCGTRRHGSSARRRRGAKPLRNVSPAPCFANRPGSSSLAARSAPFMRMNLTPTGLRPSRHSTANGRSSTGSPGSSVAAETGQTQSYAFSTFSPVQALRSTRHRAAPTIAALHIDAIRASSLRVSADGERSAGNYLVTRYWLSFARLS